VRVLPVCLGVGLLYNCEMAITTRLKKKMKENKRKKRRR
jgi:hypothetical protein